MDPETRRGRCASCGEVPLKRRKKPDGSPRWACQPGEARWRTTEKRLSKNRAALRVTDADVARMVDEQNGACLICLTDLRTLPPRNVHLDHNHATGRIRGVLCARCNAVLGYMHDSPEIAGRAAAYLAADYGISA